MTDDEFGVDADATRSGSGTDNGVGPPAVTDGGSSAEDIDDEPGDDYDYGVVLDYLPHGHPDDDRPQYQKSPVAHVLGEASFLLYEVTLDDDSDVGFGDRIPLTPDDQDSDVERMRRIDHEDLTRGARQELEYAVEEIVDRHERRFVDFYNDAQSITLRLHQLNLLPGIGKKLRNNVLDERKRGPYETFDGLEERVSGLHDPKGVLVDRIMEEIREEDLKYPTFVGEETVGDV
jgi:putative nucleotide binding protein